MTLVLKSIEVVSASELVRVPVSVQMSLLSQPVNLVLLMAANGNKDNSGVVPKAVALSVRDVTRSALVNPPSKYFVLKRSVKVLELRPALVVRAEIKLLILVEKLVAAASR